jgi:hypothetical protein
MKPAKRTRIIQLRLTEEEYSALESIQPEFICFSEHIRTLLREIVTKKIVEMA